MAGLSGYFETSTSALDDLDYREKHVFGSQAVDAVITNKSATGRVAFIDGMTEMHKKKRRILRSSHYFDLPDSERKLAERAFANYLEHRGDEMPTKDFFEIQDICGRVAGIGSMGRYRYAVLVNGKGNVKST